MADTYMQQYLQNQRAEAAHNAAYQRYAMAGQANAWKQKKYELDVRKQQLIEAAKWEKMASDREKQLWHWRTSWERQRDQATRYTMQAHQQDTKMRLAVLAEQRKLALQMAKQTDMDQRKAQERAVKFRAAADSFDAKFKTWASTSKSLRNGFIPEGTPDRNKAAEKIYLEFLTVHGKDPETAALARTLKGYVMAHILASSDEERKTVRQTYGEQFSTVGRDFSRREQSEAAIRAYTQNAQALNALPPEVQKAISIYRTDWPTYLEQVSGYTPEQYRRGIQGYRAQMPGSLGTSARISQSNFQQSGTYPLPVGPPLKVGPHSYSNQPYNSDGTPNKEYMAAYDKAQGAWRARDTATPLPGAAIRKPVGITKPQAKPASKPGSPLTQQPSHVAQKSPPGWPQVRPPTPTPRPAPPTPTPRPAPPTPTPRPAPPTPAPRPASPTPRPASPTPQPAPPAPRPAPAAPQRGMPPTPLLMNRPAAPQTPGEKSQLIQRDLQGYLRSAMGIASHPIEALLPDNGLMQQSQFGQVDRLNMGSLLDKSMLMGLPKKGPSPGPSPSPSSSPLPLHSPSPSPSPSPSLSPSPSPSPIQKAFAPPGKSAEAPFQGSEMIQRNLRASLGMPDPMAFARPDDPQRDIQKAQAQAFAIGGVGQPDRRPMDPDWGKKHPNVDPAVPAYLKRIYFGDPRFARAFQVSVKQLMEQQGVNRQDAMRATLDGLGRQVAKFVYDHGVEGKPATQDQLSTLPWAITTAMQDLGLVYHPKAPKPTPQIQGWEPIPASGLWGTE